MSISKVSGYLHVYEAYRVPEDDKGQESQGKLELTEKAKEQMVEDRQNYSNMLHLEEMAQQSRKAQGKMEEEVKNQAKVMAIFRRISKGDIVPQLDEKKLMEYDQKLYMAAKQSQAMSQREERKKHDSLWKDEEKRVQPEEGSVDIQGEMKEFADAQAKAVVEVRAPQAETAPASLGNSVSGAIFDASV